MNHGRHTKKGVMVFSFIMTLALLYSGCTEQRTQPGKSNTDTSFTTISDSPEYYTAQNLNVTVKDKVGKPCVRAITTQNDQLVAFVSIVDPVSYKASYFLERYNATGEKIDENDITSDFAQGAGSITFGTDGMTPILLDCQSDRIAIYEVDTSNLTLRKCGELLNIGVSELKTMPQISPAQTLFCSRLNSSGLTIEEYSLSGNLLHSHTSASFLGGVYFLSGNTYALGTEGKEGKSDLFLLGDSDTDILATNLTNPVRNADQLILAGSKFYTVTTDGILQYDIEKKNCRQVIAWQESGLDTVSFSYTDHWVSLNSKCFAVFSEKEGNESRICILTESAQSPQKDRQELILGGFFTGDLALTRAVQLFNEENENYFIALQDYSTEQEENGEYYSNGHKDEFFQKLMLDIAAGEGPDLLWFDVSGQDLPAPQTFEAAGLLLDIAPYLQKDSLLRPEDLQPDILNASYTDGKLYKLPISSLIYTFQNVDHLPVDTFSSIDSLKQGMTTLPSGSLTILGDTQTQLLYNLLLFRRDILYSPNATPQFASDSFAEALSFAKTYGIHETGNDTASTMNEQSRIDNGQIALVWQAISGPQDLLSPTDIALRDYVGLPGSTGARGLIYPQQMIAIPSCTKNPEGAYAFIRTMMGEEVQSIILGYEKKIPTRESVFSYSTGEKPYPDNFNEISLAWKLDSSETADPLSDKEQKALVTARIAYQKLVVDSNLLYYPDEAEWAIIEEEVQAYFDDQKSAEEVSKIIQNRIQIYIGEDFG